MTSLVLTAADVRGVPVAARRRPPVWPLGLSALVVLSAVLTAWSIGGSASEYYATIALSMSRSWSNFLFGSFDPAGTVTLDKIPGSFWIPALFVRVFGYAPWVVVLPNALAAIGAVVVTAVTARRLRGTTAGLLAGGIVATTPVLVAVSRSNQPQSFFVLGLALTAWAAIRAVERAGFGWLLLAGVFIAGSFQTYMIQAWAVWPALAAAYLCTSQPWGRKIRHLAVAGTTSLVLSLSWIFVVSLFPPGTRPYMGSTVHDSPWEMVFGYNGLGRFGATEDDAAYRSFTPPFSGGPGIDRLFIPQVAGQIAWLLPVAILSIIVLWRLRFPRTVTVFLAVWLLTFVGMFSVVAGMHQFYTSSLAIPMALLVALAVAQARTTRTVWPQIALPAAAAGTALAVSLYYGIASLAVAVVQTGLAVAVIVLLRRSARGIRVRRGLLATLTAGALLLTPAAWSAATIANPNAINPTAGLAPPTQQVSATAPTDGSTAPGGVGAAASAPLISYLEANQDGARYLAATFGALNATDLILSTDGGSVLPIGGFSGNDPVPTLAGFQTMVATGEVRYVLASTITTTGTAGERAASSGSQIREWVWENCTPATDAPVRGVYDCRG